LDPALQSGGISLGRGSAETLPLPAERGECFPQITVAAKTVKRERLPVERVGGVGRFGIAHGDLGEELSGAAVVSPAQTLPGGAIKRIGRIGAQPGDGNRGRQRVGHQLDD
jgi:hypothetical protein